MQVAGVASAEAGGAARNKVNLHALVEIHEDDVEHVHQQQDYRLVPVTSTTVKGVHLVQWATKKAKDYKSGIFSTKKELQYPS